MNMSLEALHRAAERRPDDPSAWLALAIALAGAALQKGDALERAAALAALRHAASIAVTAALIGAIAACLAELDELDEALMQMARIEEGPQGASAAHYRLVARRLLDAGRGSDALTLLGHAASLVDSDVDLRLLRALALSAGGEVGRALADVEAVIATSPELADAHLVRAQLLAGQKRSNECITAWETAARLRPDDPRAATGLGVALAAAGRFDEAIEVLFKVVQSNASASEAYQNLAIVLREAHRLDEAEWAARRAIELSPDMAQPHHDLGLVLEAAARLDEAAQAFRDATQRGGAWHRPFLALARVLDRLGRIEEAIEILGRAAGQKARDPEGRKEIADALAALRARSGPHRGAFAGNLAAFSIWQILEILQNHRSVGRLEVSLEDEKAAIFVRDGSLVRIASDQTPPLGTLLLSLSDVDLPRLAKALGEIKGESDYDVAVRVRQLGLMSGTRLRQVVERQVQHSLERLIDRTDGTFAFHKETFERGGTDVELDIRFVLLEIARMRDDPPATK